jgi:hypothetical protein
MACHMPLRRWNHRLHCEYASRAFHTEPIGVIENADSFNIAASTISKNDKCHGVDDRAYTR